MPKRVVTIFGGSGFVGRHAVARLAADGWIIRVAVRDVEAAAFLKPMGDAGQVVPIPVAITDADAVRAAVDGATAAVNLVGILYEKGASTFERMHVEGADNVATACTAAGVKRLVHVSAIGANLDSPAGYARTKAAGERAVRAAFPAAVVLRPSVVFGPEDDFFNRFARMSVLAPLLPVFPATFQPVYVGDVAEAIRRSLDREPAVTGDYELGGPRVITFREVMELVLRYTGRRRLLVPLPLSVAALQAMVLELLPVPPLTRDQVKMLAVPNVITPGARTLSDLGIEPTSVEAILPTYLSA
jgi:NADH dehydrogenase